MTCALKLKILIHLGSSNVFLRVLLALRGSPCRGLFSPQARDPLSSPWKCVVGGGCLMGPLPMHSTYDLSGFSSKGHWGHGFDPGATSGESWLVGDVLVCRLVFLLKEVLKIQSNEEFNELLLEDVCLHRLGCGMDGQLLVRHRRVLLLGSGDSLGSFPSLGLVLSVLLRRPRRFSAAEQHGRALSSPLAS